MTPTQAERKPNKFNEIFSTANRFLGPAKAENPFVKKSNAEEVPADRNTAQEATPASHSA